MSLPCPVPSCDRVMPGNLRVCRACSGRLLRDLDDVPALAADLDIALTRQARFGEDGGGLSLAPDDVDPEIGLTVRRSQLPWDQRARDATDILKSALVGWHRILSEGAPTVFGPTCVDCAHPSCEWTDLGRTPPDTLTGLSRWLLRHRVRLFRHPAVDEAVDELTDAVRHARRTIDRPPGTWYAGPCAADTDDGECTADLYARHGADTIRCHTCGARHDTHLRQAWLLRQAADHLATATEAARALHAYYPDLTPSKVRGMAFRGRILARGRDDRGRPLYRVGDVIDLLAGVDIAPFVGPACATCRHTTCRRIRGDEIAQSA
ncbi:hypothetical protein AB0B89_23680 [Sphaerisporangium sp. NPDC049002]|uniref:hypothetical protein n=1 Tax=Sphaerisporangium sp. NPDC049002 TaxID=3155392 RepID=UPI0033C3F2B3